MHRLRNHIRVVTGDARLREQVKAETVLRHLLMLLVIWLPACLSMERALAAYTHQPADTNCVACHDGSLAPGMTSPPHIPIAGVQCSSCHSSSAASFTSYTMVHAAVATLRCDACHNGAYANQGSQGAYGTADFAGHVSTGGLDCISCHAAAAVSFASWANASYTHLPTDTNCVVCHNGSVAPGMTSPPHIPVASVQCSSCHSNAAASFTSYAMNHLAVSAMRCDTCHNGAFLTQGSRGAYGTSAFAGHVPTGGLDCISCHAAAAASFASWANASYTHQPSDTNCVLCHNSSFAPGLSTPPHIPTASLQCSNCHSSAAPSFTIYSMSHLAVSAMRCDACHNGYYLNQGVTGALGTANFAGHMPTAGQDCLICHTQAARSFATWAVPSYTHLSSDTNCVSCHNGVLATGEPAPPHIPTPANQCSNCHSDVAGGTGFSAAPGYAGMGITGHVAEAAARCDACHNGQYVSQGTNGGAMGAPHNRAHLLAGSADCNTCHTAAATTFLNWLLNCR